MASKIKVDQIVGSTGNTVVFPAGQTVTITDGLTVAGGGTGLASFTAGDVLYATGSTTLAKLAKGTAEQVLAMNAGATAPDWGSVDLTVLPTISVAKGGTSFASFTAGDILYATGTTTLAKLAKGTAAQALVMNAGATAPEWATAAGGKIQQVVQLYKTDVTTQLGGGYDTFYDIGGFSQAITPTKASSKILVQMQLCIGNRSDYGSAKVQADIDSAGYNDIGMPDASGSRTRGWVGNTYDPTDGTQTKMYGQSYLWTPTYTLTDVLTFKGLWSCNSGSTVVLNRSNTATNSNLHYLGTSSLTLWEIN